MKKNITIASYQALSFPYFLHCLHYSKKNLTLFHNMLENNSETVRALCR